MVDIIHLMYRNQIKAFFFQMETRSLGQLQHNQQQQQQQQRHSRVVSLTQLVSVSVAQAAIRLDFLKKRIIAVSYFVHDCLTMISRFHLLSEKQL